jgi:hypothetical protein
MLHRMGFRFRLHRRDLPGQPDIVLSENHIRTYWWCSPDKIGMATMTPVRWTARPRAQPCPTPSSDTSRRAAPRHRAAPSE